MIDVARKPVEFSVMEVGEILGPVELVLDEHYVNSAIFTSEDRNPWYQSGEHSAFGRPIVPPAALLCDLLRLLYTRYDPDRDLGLHQHEEFEFFGPAYVGEAVRLEGRFIDKYARRGRGYIVSEGIVRAVSDGRVIVRHVAVETTDISNADRIDTAASHSSAARNYRPIDPKSPERSVRVDKIAPPLAVGTVLSGPTHVLRQDQMSIFSGAHLFWHSIHTDLEVAQRGGLQKTVAQGLMVASYFSAWCTRLLGPAWLCNGKGRLTFLKPMYVGDSVTLYAEIVKNDGGHVQLDVWARNQSGEVTAVGDLASGAWS